MPISELELGKTLQSVTEMTKQLENIVKLIEEWRPVIEELKKQQSDNRSRNLSLTVAAAVGFSLFFLTAATWYLRSNNAAVPYNYNTLPPVNNGGR